jgi:hypothetical protein
MTMKHAIHQIRGVEVLGPSTLRLRFEDGVIRTVDLRPVLRGELYGPLRDPDLFSQVRIDPEVQTVVWPNGADFDPATLYDWDERSPDLIALAQSWPSAPAETLALHDAPPPSPPRKS